MLQTSKVLTVQTINQSGAQIITQGSRKAILFTENGQQIWAPYQQGIENHTTVTYDHHKKGDTFVATRDSRRNDEAGNPLYLKGETVTRDAESLEYKASSAKAVEVSFKEKMEIMKELGMTPTFAM